MEFKELFHTSVLISFMLSIEDFAGYISYIDLT